MNSVYKLMRSGSDEDYQIARAVLLGKYKEKLKTHCYEVFKKRYILAGKSLPKVLEEDFVSEFLGVEYYQFDFTHEELYGENNKATE